MSFSNAWKWNVKVKSLSRARLFVTPWTAAYQAPPSMEFSRKEYWSGLPLPSPKKKKRKKSDTCSLFPPFGDPWPSFLLASQHAFLSSIHPFLGSSILKNEDFPDGAVVKNPSAMQETQRYRFSFWVRKIPWSRQWQHNPVFLPGKSHWQRSLVGYRPSDRKELDTTEWLSKKAAFRR